MRLSFRLGATLVVLLFAGPPLAVAQECSPAAAPAPIADVRAAIDHGWTRADVENVIDGVAAVGGLALGAASIVGTGGLIVPIGAAVLSGWTTYRSISRLVAMSRNQQSLNPLKSGDARSQWLSLAASVAGIAALGTSLQAAALLTNGAPGAATAVAMASRVAVASQVTSTVSLVNGGAELAIHWKELEPGERLSRAAGLAIGVGMMGWQAHQAGGVRNLYDAGAIRDGMIRAYPRRIPLPDPETKAYLSLTMGRDYEKFKKEVGGLDYIDWIRRGGHDARKHATFDSEFEELVGAVVRENGRIHFNLTGLELDGPNGALALGGNTPAPPVRVRSNPDGPRTTGFTNWELSQIRHRKELWDRTVFHLFRNGHYEALNRWELEGLGVRYEGSSAAAHGSERLQ